MLKETFAPTNKPHPFEYKRISLKNSFYELFEKDHVHLVEIHWACIVSFTLRRIKTREKEWELKSLSVLPVSMRSRVVSCK